MDNMTTTNEDAYKANRTNTGYYSSLEVDELRYAQTLDEIDRLQASLKDERRELKRLARDIADRTPLPRL